MSYTAIVDGVNQLADKVVYAAVNELLQKKSKNKTNKMQSNQIINK